MSEPPNTGYDVVIVGAGVAGATIAKTIADHGGRRILIIEAGRGTGMGTDKWASHVDAFQSTLAKLPNSPYPDNPNVPQPSEASLHQLVGPPTPDAAPSNVVDDASYMVQTGPLPFSSSYTRALGGTTLHWLGTSLRMLPNDFRLHSEYGQGVDWPIGYDDLKPFYERAETEIIGVSGDVSDQTYPGIDEHFFGDYQYPMERVPSSYVDQHVAERIDGFEVQLADGPHEIRVSNTPAGRNSTPRAGYQPVGAVGDASQGHRCEGNSSCIPICPVQAKYSALRTLSDVSRRHPDTAQPGPGQSSVRIVTQAVAHQVEVDEHGMVTGIACKRYQDEASPAVEEFTVRGSVYVLAAHAIENAKLLLASGIANTSGQVGRNLMDHPLILTWGLMPDKVWSYRGPGSTSGIPAFRDGPFRREHSAFRVEIGNWGWTFAAGAPKSTFEALVGSGDTGHPGPLLHGRRLRSRLSEIVPRQFRMAWEMEQIPEESNFVTIDDRYRDRIGNLRPVIRYDLPDYVRAGMAAASNAARQVFDRLGMPPLDADARDHPNEFPVGRDYTRYDRDAPGYLEYRGAGFAFEGAGHVAGTHRMGSAKSNSVVNAKQQSWDHPNLYLVGCGNMPTVGTSNPTLTMTALAIQAGENVHQHLEGSR